MLTTSTVGTLGRRGAGNPKGSLKRTQPYKKNPKTPKPTVKVTKTFLEELCSVRQAMGLARGKGVRV